MATKFVKLAPAQDILLHCETGYYIQEASDSTIEDQYVMRFCFCEHPHEMLPLLAASDLIPGADVSQLPEQIQGYRKIPRKIGSKYIPMKYLTTDDDNGDVVGNPEVAVHFIWHGTSAISALAWVRYLQDQLTQTQFNELMQWVEESYM